MVTQHGDGDVSYYCESLSVKQIALGPSQVI